MLAFGVWQISDSRTSVICYFSVMICCVRNSVIVNFFSYRLLIRWLISSVLLAVVVIDIVICWTVTYLVGNACGRCVTNCWFTNQCNLLLYSNDFLCLEQCNRQPSLVIVYWFLLSFLRSVLIVEIFWFTNQCNLLLYSNDFLCSEQCNCQASFVIIY